MNFKSSTKPNRIASLHLHPTEGGAPFQNVQMIEVIAGEGIAGNPRYFSRKTRSGEPSKRQVSLIEREQIAEHATALGLEKISPGVVRANIETLGVNLIDLIGKHVQIGDAILFFYEARLPCSKMDAICQGLRELMTNNRQGVLAQIIKSGTIRVGNTIKVCDAPVPLAAENSTQTC